MRSLALLLVLSATAAAQPQSGPASAPQHTISLAEAIAAARAHQPNLLQAHAQTEAAKARIDEARAPLLPQLTGRALYQHAERQSSSTFLGGGTPSGDLWSASLGVTQLIWDFGNTTERWHAAQSSAEAQADTEVATDRTLVLNVRTLFFQARAGRALVGVAQETVANQQKHLNQVLTFIQVGTRPEIDAASARTQVANARLALIRSENAYATAKAQLNQAMGVEASTDYDVADESLAYVQSEDGTTDQLLDEAIKNRPELAALRAQRMSQEQTISSIKGQYWPTIGVVGTATEQGPALDNLGWSLVGSVTLTWQIFSGLSTQASVREAEWNRTVIDAQLAAERQTVRLEAEQALLAVRAAKGEVATAEEALTSAREQLRLAEGRYQTGVGNIIELDDAQVAVTSAAAQKVQAEFDLASARAQLLHVLGRV
jgi:outer membrane protein